MIELLGLIYAYLHELVIAPEISDMYMAKKAKKVSLVDI